MRRPGLPSLDLLRGFESAARHLSFTRAASELFVTQSAISRQIKALEDHLGVQLFRRFNRSLLLTDAGQLLQRTAADVMRRIDETTTRLRDGAGASRLNVTTTVSFASLWLVPRLAQFRKTHPGTDVRISADNEMLNLAREQVDVAIRFCEPRAAPAGALRLAGEEIFPVCGLPLLRDRDRPLKRPEDLAHHVLLHLDDRKGRWPWLNWAQWFDALKIPEVKPSGELRFSHYDQLIQAAIDGEGVALGRNPLVARLIRKGLLAAPFDRKAVTSREYFIIVAAPAAGRTEVKDFVAWLLDEVSREAQADPGPPARSAKRRNPGKPRSAAAR